MGQLLIDKTILRDCKRRHKSLLVDWTDYRKSYDILLHLWIIECLGRFKVVNNVTQLLVKCIRSWTTEVTSCGQILREVYTNKGILQGDIISLFLFVLCMTQSKLVLKRSNARHEWGLHEFRNNHSLLTDNHKLLDNPMNNLGTLD